MFKTIRSKIFISYSSFFLLIIVAFITSFYFYISNSLEKKSSESLHTLSYSINTQLDSELKTANSLITRIWYSSTFKELFYSDIYNLNSENLIKQRKLNEIIYNIIGPDYPSSQINIFQMQGNFFSIGSSYYYSNLASTNILKVGWVEKVLDLGGKKIIIPPHRDDWGISNRSVISLCKAFKSGSSKSPDTVIEIQQDYNNFAEIVTKVMKSSGIADTSEKSVFVFNSNGEAIYPADNKTSGIYNKISFYVDLIKRHPDQSKTIHVINPDTKNKDMIAYGKSEFSDWTVVVCESENVLLNPVKTFRNMTILATFIVLLVLLLLSYLVSSTLTTPIKMIHKNIKKLNLEALPRRDSLQINSGINELEELNLSFTEMCIKLKVSLEEIVLSRSQEIQSRFLALQSQMNPHFLYNIISNISVMAEDKGDKEVVEACKNLSNMLRYISSESNVPVTIRQELQHTNSFIDLMKIRYEDNLVLKIYIPEDILDIKIPKLVIQPLVENCTKYGINLDPPWEITIEGKYFVDSWTVTVRDNGQGFDDHYLESLKDNLASIDPFNHSVNLKLDGMGLINIYARLKLMYGSEAIFELSNHPDGGAIVKIGGPVKYS